MKAYEIKNYVDHYLKLLDMRKCFTLTESTDPMFCSCLRKQRLSDVYEA